MTKKTKYFTLFLALIAALVTPTTVSAQDVDARTVAAHVQAFYDQTDTFQARFHQTYYSRLYGRYERSSGTMVIDKPGRMRFDYAAPNGKVIVADGRKLTMWEPGDDGRGPGQYMTSEMERSALPGAFSFLTGQGRLEQDYTFRLLNARAWGWRGDVLELTPRNPDPRYRRVILFVDADPSRRGVVHRLRIDDHEGNRNKFDMTSMRFNRSVSTQSFAFRPPVGARRVSL
jgi:outer membrane lipoprotein carrier protein